MNSLKKLNIVWVSILLFVVFSFLFPDLTFAAEVDSSLSSVEENSSVSNNELELISDTTNVEGETTIANDGNEVVPEETSPTNLISGDSTSVTEEENLSSASSDSNSNALEEQSFNEDVAGGTVEVEPTDSTVTPNEQDTISTSIQENSNIDETIVAENNVEETPESLNQVNVTNENKIAVNNTLVVNTVNTQTPYFRTMNDAGMYTKSGTTFVKVGTLKSGNEYVVDQYIDDKWIRIKVGEQEIYVERANISASTGESIVSSLINPQTDFNFFNVMYNANQKVYGQDGKEMGQLLKDGTIRSFGSEGYYVLVDFGGRKGYINRYMVTPEFTQYHGYFHVYGDLKAYSDTKNYVGVTTLKAGEDYRIDSHIDNRWLRIKVGAQTAYVEKPYVTPSNGGPILSSILQPNTYWNFYNVAYSTNQKVYGKEGNTYKEIGQLLKGGTTRSFGSEDYYVLVEFGGRKGYINRYMVMPEFTQYHGYFHVYGDLKAYSDTTSYKPLTTLKAGEDYRIDSHIDNRWLQIKVGTQTAYVEKLYVTPSNGAPIVTSILRPNTYFNFYDVVYKVTQKVYSKEGNEYKEIGQLLNDGTGDKKIRSYGSEDYYVLVDFGGRKGYINRYMITPEFTQYHGYFHVYADLKAYSDTSNYKGVTTLKAGEDYRIDKQINNKWLKIKIGDDVAYVEKAYVTPSNGAPIVTSILRPNTYFNFYDVAYEANQMVYSKEGNEYKEIGPLMNAGVIRAYGSEGYYVLVDFGGRKGCINRYMVKPTFDNTHHHFYVYADVKAYSDMTSFKEVTLLKAGQNYTIDQQINDTWIRIKNGDMHLYVEKYYVTPAIVGDPYKVAAYYLPLFKDEAAAKNTSYLAYATTDNLQKMLNYGNTVNVLESDGYVSVVMDALSGNVGWMYSDYLVKDLNAIDWLVKQGRNLRQQPMDNATKVGYVSENSIVKVLDIEYLPNNIKTKTWAKVRLADGQVGWMWAALETSAQVYTPYRDDKGFNLIRYDTRYPQGSTVSNIGIFTDLRTKANVTADQLNSFIQYQASRFNETSAMLGMGSAILEASKLTGLNPLYIMAHAGHESAWGTSKLANGKYNFFGIGAVDRCSLGTSYDCANTFSSAKDGVIQGVKWINDRYQGDTRATRNNNMMKQVTLDAMVYNGYLYEYASDRSWHVKIAQHITSFLNYKPTSSIVTSPTPTPIVKPTGPIKKIVIDPGHGGRDPGAVGNDLQEKDLTLILSKKIEYYLNTLYTGHEVKLTRTSDTYPTLDERVAMANNWGADVFVSIHLNSSTSSASGYEDIIYSRNFASTARLQDIMHQQVGNVFSANSLTVRHKRERIDLRVLNGTNMDAILTENGFISNEKDMSKMKQESFQNAVAKAHVNAIAEFLSLSRK
ncbi:N-acetylmuramoyl-L-alanine amidase [Massilibacterium senegalense]|uniref:N-acetylmuramoyl-L-alanine amidase n=1 Tax=Massilibacterium senegalense TaxID=1632858 RepID=UPI000786263F|nr:N-acetylmuramoyl-L-alanine amidase [Massilibacterium senegalense]